MPAIILIDLGFGDAGKGSLVDYLTRAENAHTVIRFNGGAQAAHNVITPEGRHHTFSQFGSGTFVAGVRTHLSRFMLVDPVALLGEAAHLRTLGITDGFERLSVDPAAPVVTPFQRAANRLRELGRGPGRHGSCGMGIGETMADMVDDPAQVLYAADLRDPGRVRAKLRQLQEHKRRQMAGTVVPPSAAADQEFALLSDSGAPEEFAELFGNVAGRLTLAPTADVLAAPGTVIFEAGQGVLLDEWHGFHPYTTWSTTTFANALTLLREADYAGPVRRVGALRAYMTRHGPGPLPTEDAALAARLPDAHNGTNPWQRSFRVGWLDLPLLRYALEIAGPTDELVLTCLDRIQAIPNHQICTRYEHPATAAIQDSRLRVLPPPNLAYQEMLTTDLARCQPIYESLAPNKLVDWLEDRFNLPITLTSHGPTHADKTPRRPPLRAPSTNSQCPRY